MTLPNFLVAGAPRCGSTSLDAYCRAHPEVFMSPIKETNFFSHGWGKVPWAGPGADRFYQTSIRDMDTYRALFRGAGSASAIGEASVNYMMHPEACAGVRAEIPHARLVFILRQPVERAWSSFQRSRREGTEPVSDFLVAWRDDGRRRAAGHWSCIHRHKSLYGRHLKGWFDTFPRRQIKVILFEDLEADADGVMRDLYSFLGVDPDFRPDTSVRHNPTREIRNPAARFLWLRTGRVRAAVAPWLPLAWRGQLFRVLARGGRATRPKETLPESWRATLTAELQDDILALQDLIGRDLSRWLSPTGPRHGRRS